MRQSLTCIAPRCRARRANLRLLVLQPTQAFGSRPSPRSRFALWATLGQFDSQGSHLVPPSELPFGSLSRRTPAPRFPCGSPAAWVRFNFFIFLSLHCE